MNIFKNFGKLIYKVTHPKKMGSVSIKEALLKKNEKIVKDKDFKKLTDFNENFVLDEDLIEEDLDDEFDDEFDDEIELENKKTKFSFRSFFAKKLSKEEKEKIVDDEDFEILRNYKKEEKTVNSAEKTNVKTKKEEPKDIYTLVFDYLSNTTIDCLKTETVFNKIDKIVELNKEDELRKFISDCNSKNISTQLRYGVLIDQMNKILNVKNNDNKNTINNDDTIIDFESLRNSKKQTSQKEESTVAESVIKVVDLDEIKTTMPKNNSNNTIVKDTKKPEVKKENHDLYKKAYEEGKLSSREYNDILVEIASQIKEEIDSSDKKQETIIVEPAKEEVKPVQKEEKIVVKEVKSTITKEESDKKHEEKCLKEYNLYQERMAEILKLNDRLTTLKSKLNELGAGTMGSDYAEVLENRAKLLKEIKEIELSIHALSNRIVVLEKRGYAREYEEKLRFEAENYTKMYENLLFEKEQEVLRKKNLESNSYILNAFSDEELEKMYSTDFYKDADKLEAAMEYKKIMGM